MSRRVFSAVLRVGGSVPHVPIADGSQRMHCGTTITEGRVVRSASVCLRCRQALTRAVPAGTAAHVSNGVVPAVGTTGHPASRKKADRQAGGGGE